MVPRPQDLLYRLQDPKTGQKIKISLFWNVQEAINLIVNAESKIHGAYTSKLTH